MALIRKFGERFIEYVGNFFQVEHDFAGYPALYAQIANNQNEGRHPTDPSLADLS
jgi:hypothetical protein